MTSSIKGLRALASLGAQAAFDRGDDVAFVGPVYELRKRPGSFVRLAFVRDEEGRIDVGYAQRDQDADWRVVEHESFTMRALGYYERRLKRIGDRLDSKARQSDW